MSEPDHDDPERFHERLDDIEAALEEAATEADLDVIEESLGEIADEIADATFPELPEPEDEEADAPPDPQEELEDRIGGLQDTLEQQRGPYANDVLDAIESARTTIETTEWAEEGHDELVTVVDDFLAVVESTVSASLARPAPIGDLSEALAAASAEVEAADLDPDDDAETIAALLDGTDALEHGVDDATAFGDLPVREQLNRKGFFEPLGHYKDFPPEWSAIKAHEEAGDVEMILLAYELLDSAYLEEHCVDAFRRLGDERALEPMMQLAQRRDHDAIEVLGKIGSEETLGLLSGYIDEDSNPLLQQVSLIALGEIGSADATEGVAQQLVAEDSRVRSAAARALGMIGDTRAVDPLADVLGDRDEAEPVRGSAAWALVEIGTETALGIVEGYRDDRSYLVEAEAAKLTRTEQPA